MTATVLPLEFFSHPQDDDAGKKWGHSPFLYVFGIRFAK
jgi:hypothetical protein